MEKKPFGEFISEASQSAKKVMKKSKEAALLATDQNADGKFDIEDVSIIADAVGTAVKKGTVAVKKSTEEMVRQNDLRVLKPIFTDTLNDGDFYLSKFIRLMDRPKRFEKSEVCQGSIGNKNNVRDFTYVAVFRDSMEAFGISFYPNSEEEFYYIDPCDKDIYIGLDEYFDYMKRARFNEMKMVAQELGAKRYNFTYKEEQTSFSNTKGKASAKAAKIASSEVEHDLEKKKYSYIELMAEMEGPGHKPQKPELKYLRNDPNISNLIKGRMDNPDASTKWRDSINLVESTGMKEKDAANIDAVLNGLKLSGNATVSSEIKNEARRYLEYEIEF